LNIRSRMTSSDQGSPTASSATLMGHPDRLVRRFRLIPSRLPISIAFCK
jgi:hypothetical protein